MEIDISHLSPKAVNRLWRHFYWPVAIGSAITFISLFFAIIFPVIYFSSGLLCMNAPLLGSPLNILLLFIALAILYPIYKWMFHWRLKGFLKRNIKDDCFTRCYECNIKVCGDVCPMCGTGLKVKYLNNTPVVLRTTFFQRGLTFFLYVAIFVVVNIVTREAIDAWKSRNNPIKEFFVTKGGSQNGNRINFRTEYYLGETVLHQGRRGKVVAVGVADRPHEIVYTVEVDGKRIYDLKGSELSRVKE